MAPSPTVHNPAPGPVAATLLTIALGLTMAGVSLAYGLDLWLHRPPAATSTATAATTMRTLVGRKLTIPTDWLVPGDAEGDGFASRVALRLTLPLGPGGAATTIAVTLLPLSQARTSASLLDGVYLHQFLPGERTGPAGLIGKPLQPGEGYFGETVWYDPLSQNPFVAKCAAAPAGDAPAQCLRTLALPGGIAAVYAFAATALDDWRNFDAAVLPALRQIGAV